jgi:6-phosphogluconolactonase (cycloisomerase 2 family)
MFRKFAFTATAALALAACSDNLITPPQSAGSTSASFSSSDNSPGALYLLTNAAMNNEILAFDRAADGSLGAATPFSTGGAGSGSGLGSQGSVILPGSGRWLLAVNAGSNDISVFRVSESGLSLTDRVASGGEMPISITLHGNLVYVVNAGGVNNISGFTISPAGTLSSIPGSTRPLSAPAPGPAQIQFSPDGSHLVVTEKGTNLILTFPLNAAGQAQPAVTHPSVGMTPFGFAFAKRNTLIVSEAFGGAAGASAVSSYNIAGGALSPVTSSLATTETAACWTVVSGNGRFAYVTNTGSGTVSGYSVDSQGVLHLLDADGVTGTTGAGSAPADAATDVSGRYLYVRSGGTNAISAFRIGSDGSLSAVGTTPIPAGAVGIAVQ